MNGRSKERQELADQPLPFEVGIPVLPARGGDALVRRLFEPLGYAVTSAGYPLDATFPEWGDAPYQTVTLAARCRLRDLLAHLYVLIPVLDDQKHYWVSDARDREAAPARRGLAAGPPRARADRPPLPRPPAQPDPRGAAPARRRGRRRRPGRDARPSAMPRRRPSRSAISLHDQRIGAVMAALRASGAEARPRPRLRRGPAPERAGQGPRFTEIVGVDVSARSLEIAARRLRLERMNERQRERLRLMQGALTYRDDRLAGFDAAVADGGHRARRARAGCRPRARGLRVRAPGHVVVTTPNAEYNVRFETLPAGRLRHRDHRFEWTRAEFAAWADRVAERFGYTVRHLPIGPEDPRSDRRPRWRSSRR